MTTNLERMLAENDASTPIPGNVLRAAFLASLNRTLQERDATQFTTEVRLLHSVVGETTALCRFDRNLLGLEYTRFETQWFDMGILGRFAPSASLPFNVTHSFLPTQLCSLISSLRCSSAVRPV